LTFEESLRAKAIAAADAHTCMVSTDDWVYCWGLDSTGQTGHGAGGTFSIDQPWRVYTPWSDHWLVRDVSTVTTGRWHTCVTNRNDKLTCWGRGDSGQLGDAGQDDSPYPLPLPPP
jgi:alpha-tubulin suppressor-like RCC1 family protein